MPRLVADSRARTLVPAMDSETRIGPLGWIRLWLGRCPRCGGRLTRVEADDQSFVHTHRTRLDGFQRPHEGHMPEIQRRVIPVYSVCRACGFRKRRRDLSEAS
ncbi:MAG: hypothetical protein JSW65_01540 [Candidatus Bipolaricaulota bacterium]|nr:MAG: hypothetical protein JSW65_01540 [Candidatus Bipolaricaulota bacterium]